jgi:hypothetical protein
MFKIRSHLMLNIPNIKILNAIFKKLVKLFITKIIYFKIFILIIVKRMVKASIGLVNSYFTNI